MGKKNASDDLTISSADNVLSALEKLDVKSGLIVKRIYDIDNIRIEMEDDYGSFTYSPITLTKSDTNIYYIDKDFNRRRFSVRIKTDFPITDYIHLNNMIYFPTIAILKTPIYDEYVSGNIIFGNCIYSSDTNIVLNLDYDSDWIRIVCTKDNLVGRFYVNPAPYLILASV